MPCGPLAAARPLGSSTMNRCLASLPTRDFSLLAPHLRTITLERGAMLHDSGDDIEHVDFPNSGMVSLVTVMRSGATVETMTVGRNGIIGLRGGLGPARASARAIVQIPGEAARIAASQLQLAVRESGAVRDLVLGYNELMLAETQQCVACNALHYLEARLCRWLLHCQDCVDADTIPLTQELLGQMLGVRRTTLTVVARLLQTSGMIRYRRGVIHIVDRAKLEHTACECYQVVKQHTDRLFQPRGCEHARSHVS